MIRRVPFAVLCLFVGLPALAADSSGYHLLKRIPLGGEGGWDYLTVDAEARRFYITRGTHVTVMDLETNQVVGEIPDTPGIHGVALATEFGRGFTSNGGDNTLTVFELKTLKPLQRVHVGKRPDAIAYDPAAKRVFTFNAGSQDSTAVDAATGTVAGTVALGGKPEFAVADGQGHVYANLEDKDEIVAIDSHALTILHRWPVAPGHEPGGLSMDREHRRLFSTCGNQKMVVLDADSGRVLTDLPIGKGTDASVFDPDERLAFSSNRDGTLTIVQEDSPDSFRVIDNVATEAGARTMALDAKTHRIYLVTAKFKPDTGAPQERPAGQRGQGGQRRRRQMEPGSFVVLIVGRS